MNQPSPRFSMSSRFRQGNGVAFAAGAAKRVITPEPLLPVSGGMGPTRPAKEKRGDLTVRALALRNGVSTLVFVSIDALGFPSVLVDRVHAKTPRIPRSSLLVGATHTHSAPDVYAFPDGKGGHTAHLPWLDLVCNRMAEAVNEALDRLQPASLRTASGPAKGRIAYNYYAPDLFDREMSVLQVNSVSGKTIATLVNYAIHPEVLGNEVGILSPDCIGPMEDAIEAKLGGMALFFNGAQGGMITADNRILDKPKDPVRGYWEDARTWDECLRIGKTMASEALRLIERAPLQKEPILVSQVEEISLPVDSDALWAVVTLSPLKYPHGPGRTIKSRVHCITIGDSRILTIPGEALPNIGLHLKRKMGGSHKFLFGLTNDAFGYILTDVDFGSFERYEYVSATSLGEQTGPLLLETWKRLIKMAPRPDKSPAR
jgi:hypothetical protein